MNKLNSMIRAGIVIFTLGAFAPISRADVVIENTANTSAGTDGSFGDYQGFDIPGGNGAIGQTLGSVTLLVSSVQANSALELYYNATSDSFSGSSLATVFNVGGSDGGPLNSHEAQVFQPNNTSYTFQSGYYFVKFNPGNSATWYYTASSAAITDFSGVTFASNSGGVASGDYYQFGVTVVPEVPVTGAAMGFGALAIVSLHTLRRKLSAAKTK